MGYMRAHKCLRDVCSQAYALHPDKKLDEAAAEEIWIELFEALNWLDALRLSRRESRYALSTSAMTSAAWSSLFGSTCAYTRIVVIGDVCPRRAATT